MDTATATRLVSYLSTWRMYDFIGALFSVFFTDLQKDQQASQRVSKNK